MSDTKVIEILNGILINDDELGAMLAENSFGDPAIYDSWAEQDVKFNYMIITYRFPAGDHWAKKSGVCNVDIFTKGPSTIEAENIKEKVMELWDRKRFSSDESGPAIRLYSNVDGVIPEDSPSVCHWNVEFSVIFWRQKFISQLISI